MCLSLFETKNYRTHTILVVEISQTILDFRNVENDFERAKTWKSNIGNEWQAQGQVWLPSRIFHLWDPPIHIQCIQFPKLTLPVLLKNSTLINMVFTAMNVRYFLAPANNAATRNWAAVIVRPYSCPSLAHLQQCSLRYWMLQRYPQENYSTGHHRVTHRKVITLDTMEASAGPCLLLPLPSSLCNLQFRIPDMRE